MKNYSMQYITYTKYAKHCSITAFTIVCSSCSTFFNDIFWIFSELIWFAKWPLLTLLTWQYQWQVFYAILVRYSLLLYFRWNHSYKHIKVLFPNKIPRNAILPEKNCTNFECCNIVHTISKIWQQCKLLNWNHCCK